MHHLDLSTLVLGRGAHDSPEDGMCLMEAAAIFAGERFSDDPACVSPVLSEAGRTLNDTLPADKRQRLVALLPRLLGTADDGLDEWRGWAAMDWLARTWVPAWLRGRAPLPPPHPRVRLVKRWTGDPDELDRTTWVWAQITPWALTLALLLLTALAAGVTR